MNSESASTLPVTRPSRVGIVAKARLRDASAVVCELADWLRTRGVEVALERDTAALAGLSLDAALSKDQIARSVDLALVLGGDGTLIGMASRIAGADTDVPILAVNFGSLGFLTEITLEELYPSLESVLAGTARTDLRQMLRSRVVRRQSAIADRLVLNDVVVMKGALSSIIELSVTVGDQFVTRFRADGLIVATPTGSTAYNLSAGGPIVHPIVDAMLLTPIAPHMLTHRPIVIPASSQTHIRPNLGNPHTDAFVSFDGQFGFQLEPDDVVNVERAPRPLRLVSAAARNYFAVLHQKLKWGER